MRWLGALLVAGCDPGLGPCVLGEWGCDAQNNPPDEVNLGNFKVEVYFYPVKPAETIIITVGQQESGASSQEA